MKSPTPRNITTICWVSYPSVTVRNETAPVFGSRTGKEISRCLYRAKVSRRPISQIEIKA
jgi:hypothetical protein